CGLCEFDSQPPASETTSNSASENQTPLTEPPSNSQIPPTQPPSSPKQPNTPFIDIPTIPTLHATADDQAPRPLPGKKMRSVARCSIKLFPITPPPEESSNDDDGEEQESPCKAVIREYHEQLAARQAARERGINPPRLPRDPNRPLPEGIRRYNELMAQVERNKQLAEESWQRFVTAENAAGREVVDPLAGKAVVITNPDGTITKRYLTWNDEEDRRRAAWRRLLDKEAARNDGRVAHTSPVLACVGNRDFQSADGPGPDDPFKSR
ncbi:MAG TPA: hypothetical protein VME86_16705, partial [Acidobacteriaceae bacterium]|nr:hypothetical protein [Acidobacteriaceae bacterium]